MKCLIAGVKRIAGTAKESGKPFDMCHVLCLTPIETSNGKTQVNGSGFELMQIPLDTNALPSFMRLAYPVQVELILEPRPRFGKVETVCAGFKEIAKAA